MVRTVAQCRAFVKICLTVKAAASQDWQRAACNQAAYSARRECLCSGAMLTPGTPQTEGSLMGSSTHHSEQHRRYPQPQPPAEQAAPS